MKKFIKMGKTLSTAKICFYAFIILLLVGLTLFPRMVEVLNHNPIFGFDQGRDYLAVKNIVVDHKLTLIGEELGAGSAGINGIFQGPFYYYFLAVPFILSNGDPYSGLVLMFLFSVGAVVLSFFLGKKLFTPLIGFLLALLVAASPPLISQARFIWNSHPSSFFICLAFYFIYRFTKKRGAWDIFLAAFFTGFIYNFEMAITIPMCLALIIYSIIIFKLEVKNYLVLLAGFFTAFLPMAVFEVRHNFMATRSIINYVFVSKQTGLSLSLLAATGIANINPFKYAFLNTFQDQQLALWILLIFIVLPIFYYLAIEKNIPLRRFFYYIILLPLSSFFVFLFLKIAVWQYYLIEINFAAIMIFTYLLYASHKHRHYFYTLILSAVIILFMFNSVVSAIRVSINDYSNYGGTAKMKGLESAINYIYKDSDGKKFSLFVFAPPIYTYQYTYMLWWYAQRKYHYLPGNSKKGLFYLWIEKDVYQPWTYRGWLSTVIVTGKVIKTVTLPKSGFIIQKRQG